MPLQGSFGYTNFGALQQGYSTFSIINSSSAINEGDTVVFNIVTSNVADGTDLYWSNDVVAGSTLPVFDDGVNDGIITIYGNAGAVPRTPALSTISSGTSKFQLSLRVDSSIGRVLRVSNTVTLTYSAINP